MIMKPAPARRRLLPKLLGASSLLTLLALPTIAQTLTVTEGLTLWLKADTGITAEASGAVTAWTDQSGNENHAAQPDAALAPTLVTDALNAKPVLRFDGTDDFLEVADSESLSGTGDITSFFVIKFDDFATFRAVWGKTAGNLPGPTDYYTVPNTGIPTLYRGNGSSAGLASFTGTPLRAGAYFVAGFGTEGDQASHFFADQVTATGTLTADVFDADTALLIGTRGDQFTRLKGDLAEVLIYDRALSASERVLVAGYLAAKYNIQNLPPSVALARTPADASVATGTTLTLTATATDTDGRIDRVEFLANGAVVATATARPYQARVTVKTSGAYRFAARATDDKDGKATSTEVALTASSGGAAPTLDVTTGLRLRLAADAGVNTTEAGDVSSWFDGSGSSNDAFQTEVGFAPKLVEDVLAGYPVVRFDGVDDYLDVNDSDSLSISGDITSLFVVKMDDFSTFRSVWAKTQLNQPAPNDYYTLPGSGIPRLYRGNAQGSLGLVDGGAPLTAGAFQIAGFSSSSGTVVHVLNGNVTSTGSITATPADLDTPLKIGTRDDFVTILQGDLAELMIYDVGLSAADLEKAQLYLGEKYKIGIVTPTNTPPVVAITAPAPNTSLPAPSTLEVQASATDSDGSIVLVEFRIDGAIAATVTNAPYRTNLTLAEPGEFILTAIAQDQLGGRTLSDPITVTLGDSATPPQISLARTGNENQITLSWPASATDFILQSTDQLPGGTWQAVPGVAGTSITIPIGSGNTFYRLAKP